MEDKKRSLEDVSLPLTSEGLKPTSVKPRLADREKEIAVDYVDRSTILGLKHILDKIFPGRIIWLLVFLIFATLTAYQISSLFIRYFKYEVQTSVEMGYKRLDFPTVTICNLNPIRFSQSNLDPTMSHFLETLRQFDNKRSSSSASNTQRRKRRSEQEYIADEEEEDLMEDFAYDEDTEEDDYIDGITFREDEDDQVSDFIVPDLKHRRDFMRHLGNIDEKIRMKMSHQKEVMILSCSYGGKECNANNFSPIISDDYNYCYQFNSITIRNISRLSPGTGPDKGLTLILYAEGIERLKGYTQTHGFRVEVHPFHTMSFAYRNGFFVSPGAETNVGLQMVNVQRLGDQYGECQGNEDFLQQYNKLYTKGACELVCQDFLIAERCKCVRPAYSQRYTEQQWNNLEFCNISKQEHFDCFKALRELGDVLEEECNCTKACEVTKFVTSISTVTWPDETLWSYIVGLICNRNVTNSTDDTIKNAIRFNCDQLRSVETETLAEQKEIKQRILRGNFALLKIYYMEWNYELISEKPDYDVNALLADLGGSGGLYLGMSIFTGIELIFLMCELLVPCCKKFKRRSS